MTGVQKPARTFFAEDEVRAIDSFLRDGYLIFRLADSDSFAEFRTAIYGWALEALSELDLSSRPGNEDDLFDDTAKYVPLASLNDFRVRVIAKIAGENDWVRPLVYQLGKREIQWLVGNELSMQRNLNLSVQYPSDTSSLLPIHSDVWDGNSPYEVVFWLPLTDCYGTRSMFVLPRPETARIVEEFGNRFREMSSEQLFREIEPELRWLEVPKGHGVIFSHTILHGNRENLEPKCRWTFNIRFKSLLTPLADKDIGESFLPITVRPATRVGYEYKCPK